MNPKPRWQEEPIATWLDALALPLTPWAHSILPEIGLPMVIAERPQIMLPIHAQAVKNYENLWKFCSSSPPAEGTEVFLSREVVNAAMKQLADVVGIDTAKVFENWARRSAVRRDWSYSFLLWRSILRRASEKSSQGVELIPPPPLLLSILPRIADLVSAEREDTFVAKLVEYGPPPSEDDRSIGLDMSPVAMAFEEVARNEWTYAALQIIAKELSQTERAEIMEWAKRQVSSMRLNSDLLLEVQLSDDY